MILSLTSDYIGDLTGFTDFFYYFDSQTRIILVMFGAIVAVIALFMGSGKTENKIDVKKFGEDFDKLFRGRPGS